MAVKLWVPLINTIDPKMSQSLFLKYIEFIEKSTSYDKIMFRGGEFPELKGADFTLKK
jgi:hypothetical protein